MQHLRADDLSRRWDVNPKTLANWRCLGKGPAFSKIGGAVRYRLDDVLAFEAARSVETADPAVA